MLRATPFDLQLLRLYDAKYLLGDLRDEFLHGHWCSTYINSKLSRGTAPLTVDDFMILHKPKKRAQTPQEMRAALLAWAKAAGAVIPPKPNRTKP